jgi:hypothetical protein
MERMATEPVLSGSTQPSQPPVRRPGMASRPESQGDCADIRELCSALSSKQPTPAVSQQRMMILDADDLFAHTTKTASPKRKLARSKLLLILCPFDSRDSIASRAEQQLTEPIVMSCSDENDAANMSKVKKLKVDPQMTKAQQTLRRFFFNVIRPNGSRAIATRFLERGCTLEDARSIP